MHERLAKTYRNRLLGCLNATDLSLLEPHLEPVQLKFRQRLEPVNQPVPHAYFIEHGMASIVAVDRERKCAEVALIGREGMSGLSLVLGCERSAHETFVQVAGSADRIAADQLQHAIGCSKSLQTCLLRYVQVVLVQVGHTALANAAGTIEERAARWLLMAHDRANGDDVALTHEFLSIMLGVRRAGVKLCLQEFKRVGLISSRRGRVTILDVNGLTKIAGGFYGAPEAETERLFPPRNGQRVKLPWNALTS